MNKTADTEPSLDYNPKRDLFHAYATPIVCLRTSGTGDLNTELKRIILERQKTDPGITKSNVEGWHSQTDLADWDDPSIATLFGLVEPAIRRLTGNMAGGDGYDGGVRFVAWANVSRARAFNRMHNHPGFHWSGVYYVDAGKAKGDGAAAGGKIEFQDPRGFASMLPLPGNPFGKTYSISPNTGMFLIFPSFLHHAVTPYTGEGERISVAFNVLLGGRSRKR